MLITLAAMVDTCRSIRRGNFHRADVFTRAFLRIGKPVLPGDSRAIYWFGFRAGPARIDGK